MPLQGFGLNKRRRDVLANLATQLTGVPCRWDADPDFQEDPLAKAKITFRVRNTHSTSEWDKITVDSGTATTTQLGAQRTAIIEVKVESFDVETTAPEIYYMLTTRIYRDRFRAILHDANMAANTNADALDLPTHYDVRVISACVGSLEIGYAEMDPFTDQLDTHIDTVNGNNIIPGNWSGG